MIFQYSDADKDVESGAASADGNIPRRTSLHRNPIHPSKRGLFRNASLARAAPPGFVNTLLHRPVKCGVFIGMRTLHQAPGNVSPAVAGHSMRLPPADRRSKCQFNHGVCWERIAIGPPMIPSAEADPTNYLIFQVEGRCN